MRLAWITGKAGSFVFALVLLAGLPGTTTAQDSGAGLSSQDRQAIRSVIASQWEAFQRDDGQEAFSYASPGIQSMFRTPTSFMQMVRQGYPMIYRPESTTFLGLQWGRTRPIQPVLINGQGSGPVTAYYFMEKQEDGSWKIDGVQLSQEPVAES